MTINLETEVVATGYDPLTRMCSYTIERGDKRWTAKVSIDELNKHKGNKATRRNHIASALVVAMQRAPDNG